MIVHQAPLEGQTITGCCGLTADELTRPYHLTTDPLEVTCRGWDPAI